MTKCGPDQSDIIRERIKRRLKVLNVTPDAVSEMAGLDRSVLRKFLRGAAKEMCDSNLEAVADALDANPAHLRGEGDQYESQHRTVTRGETSPSRAGQMTRRYLTWRCGSEARIAVAGRLRQCFMWWRSTPRRR